MFRSAAAESVPEKDNPVLRDSRKKLLRIALDERLPDVFAERRVDLREFLAVHSEVRKLPERFAISEAAELLPGRAVSFPYGDRSRREEVHRAEIRRGFPDSRRNILVHIQPEPLVGVIRKRSIRRSLCAAERDLREPQPGFVQPEFRTLREDPSEHRRSAQKHLRAVGIAVDPLADDLFGAL